MELIHSEYGQIYQIGLPTFHVLHPLLEVFLETAGAVVLRGPAGPEVEGAVVGVAVAFAVGVAPVSEVAEPGVVFVVDLEVAEPRVASVAVVVV